VFTKNVIYVNTAFQPSFASPSESSTHGGLPVSDKRSPFSFFVIFIIVIFHYDIFGFFATHSGYCALLTSCHILIMQYNFFIHLFISVYEQ